MQLKSFSLHTKHFIADPSVTEISFISNSTDTEFSNNTIESEIIPYQRYILCFDELTKTKSKKLNRLFWDKLIQEYLWPGTSLGMIIQSLISLNFNAIKVLAGTTTFKPSLILIVALSEVWKAHWRFIFDQIPLTSAPLFASFRRALAKVQSEKTLYTSSG